MKILYVIPKPNVSGLQTSSRNRINALRAEGIQAEVAFHSPGDGDYIFQHIQTYYINNKDQFREHIKKNKYDFISFIYSLKYLDAVPTNFSGKIIYEVRGWSSGVVKGIRKINKSFKVHAVICIAKYLKPLVKTKLVRNIPVFIDGNTVDPSFHYKEKITLEDFPVPEKGRKIIAFIGRVENSKNWKEFITISHHVSFKHQIELWIICNPNTSKCLKDMKKQLKKIRLYSSTRIIPNVPNHKMPELYSLIANSGGCVLSTSLREGLGNAILEPMACACPIVSSNRKGKNEIIQHNYNGLLYKTDDIEEAVKQIDRLIENKSKRTRLTQNGLKTIEKDYSQNSYVSKYLTILSKIK
ncbi:glycosyltransferase family 4 protein [Evansella tamaricis]|uniref:Glycosyltransferase family 4 protein n=1 Tax=Evansella tamaricis TaxID=2069301 RepID=A0ABS6JIU5_9BACI|nr:glycosyltransferase family 4 protein [Evansella tamaricis]MBU9713310.1 glycosyltransferase family 4 protein [Evansella tamaricis]